MDASSLGRTDDPSTRSVNKKSVEDGLDAGKLRGNLLAQASVVAQFLGLDTIDDLTTLRNKRVELFVRPHIQCAETIEELTQVSHRCVAENLGFAVFVTAQPLGKMRHQLRQFFDERLLGHLYGFIETGLHAAALLLVQFWVELLQIRRRLDAGKVPRDIEHPNERRWIVSFVVQTAESILCRRFERCISLVESGHGFVEFILEDAYLFLKRFECVLPHEANTRLGIGQTERGPVGLAPDCARTSPP